MFTWIPLLLDSFDLRTWVKLWKSCQVPKLGTDPAQHSFYSLPLTTWKHYLKQIGVKNFTVPLTPIIICDTFETAYILRMTSYSVLIICEVWTDITPQVFLLYLSISLSLLSQIQYSLDFYPVCLCLNQCILLCEICFCLNLHTTSFPPATALTGWHLWSSLRCTGPRNTCRLRKGQ